MTDKNTYFVKVQVPFSDVIVEVEAFSPQLAMRACLNERMNYLDKHDIEVGEIIGVSVE